ncbi:MAG: hypothetical protein LWX51_17855 [Deltaproteobacteria bacterium]|nr:hypothetical protein [Deltaproteobacteria bacterium]
MRVETYFRQIEKIIEACPVIQLSNVTYEKRGTHEGFIRGELCVEDRLIPSAAPDLATVLQEIESLIQLP